MSVFPGPLLTRAPVLGTWGGPRSPGHTLRKAEPLHQLRAGMVTAVEAGPWRCVPSETPAGPSRLPLPGPGRAGPGFCGTRAGAEGAGSGRDMHDVGRNLYSA